MSYNINNTYSSFLFMKIDQKSKAPDSVVTLLSELGGALRGYRLVKRMTHEDVAAACGFSRQTLSRIERGDPSVAIGQVARYAELLGASKALSLKMPQKVEATQRRVRHTTREREGSRKVSTGAGASATASSAQRAEAA